MEISAKVHDLRHYQFGNRKEITTEGGLDVASQISRMKEVCAQLSTNNIKTSLFIDADKRQIDGMTDRWTDRHIDRWTDRWTD